MQRDFLARLAGPVMQCPSCTRHFFGERAAPRAAPRKGPRRFRRRFLGMGPDYARAPDASTEWYHGAVAKPNPNIYPVDRFTPGHAAMGFMLGLWGMPWYLAFGSSVTFELLENFVLKPAFPRIFPVGKTDAFVNASFDTVAWMTGWGLGKAIPGPEAPVWGGRRLWPEHRSASLAFSGTRARGRVGPRRISVRTYGAKRN